jgi:2-iminobutanoate/2-iminopropanoate deaminase
MKKCLSLLLGLALMTSVSFTQEKKVVATKEAPQPIGPYSQAIKASGFVFASGQIALDPATGKLIEGDIKAQTERVLKNLSAVLAAAGSSMDRVVRTTVFLKNISDFPAMNEVYGQFFKNEPPSRSTVQVAALPKDALIEIDAVRCNSGGRIVLGEAAHACCPDAPY